MIRPLLPMSLSEEQEAELARLEMAQREMKRTLSSQRLANRMTRQGPIMSKQAFIDGFVADDRLASYPVIDQDVADEHERAESRACKGVTIREALVEELRHTFTIIRPPTDVDPAVLAHDLLRSEHGAELRRIKDLRPDEVSVEVVLAHVESLAYGLSPRLAVSIARRVMLLLLKRGEFRPDGRRRRKKS